MISHIATGLTYNTTLQELDIGNNRSVTSDGWVQLFQTIRNGITSVQKLDIGRNNLQSEHVIALSGYSYKPMEVDQRRKVVTALSEMISRNKGIQELTISEEFIENEHKLLARSLVQNTTLQKLCVYSSTGLNDVNILREEIKKLKQEEGIVPHDWNLKITI